MNRKYFLKSLLPLGGLFALPSTLGAASKQKENKIGFVHCNLRARDGYSDTYVILGLDGNYFKPRSQEGYDYHIQWADDVSGMIGGEITTKISTNGVYNRIGAWSERAEFKILVGEEAEKYLATNKQ
jgi:hypothetical protein